MLKKLLKILIVVLLLTCVSGCSKKRELTEVFEYVFDAGTYTELDYDYAEEYFQKEYDNWGGGGCTAVAKVVSNGDMLVGRNMDLNISNKAAYIFRTDCKDCYKTINLMYTFRDFSPYYSDVKENGLPEEFEKIMPFLADDVLNEKGLYIEVNMRNGEFWPTGESKFSCSGTNPDAEEKVYMFTLARYIGEHCANVDEAIEYVKTLNVYSQDGYWNYCFLMADESGHYGVLEFGFNEVYWLDYEPAQANFYLSEDLAALQELKAGEGRYEVVTSGRDAVDSEEDMFKLMDKASYFQYYDPDNCAFDYRPETTGALAFATYDFVMDEENKELVDTCVRMMGDYVRTLDRQTLQDANEYWESAFTEVINCNNRTIHVRFFENEDKVTTIGFDD